MHTGIQQGKKNTQISQLDLSAVLLASNAGIRDLQAYSPTGIQGPHSLVILHPVQKSRLSFISQFGDHKSSPASLHPLEAQIFYSHESYYGNQVILFH